MYLSLNTFSFLTHFSKWILFQRVTHFICLINLPTWNELPFLFVENLYADSLKRLKESAIWIKFSYAVLAH